MKIEEYVVLTFNSTHHAISGEKIFKDNDIGFKTIPTPREITLSCGLSILFALEDLDKVKDLVKNNALAIKGVYRYNIKGKEKHVTEIEW
ncbi:DUF3343 domain-containing protein [Tissierella creatinini]|nr:DUF3343 domain-containing protein [Tissierella creatinini]TJX62244.1 DUF3343 domain-containing protein [Soehngenia saccharolytica]